MKTNDLIAGLPGETLVRQGLADLQSGRRTVPACLVGIARARLRHAGLTGGTDVLPPQEPELQLYRLLRREGGDAYSRYNSLLRELVSFEQALDRRRSRGNEALIKT
jgi:hypothetical protein